jgi:beta-mannosidase
MHALASARLALTAAHAYATPGDLPEALDWLPATIPGTVAGALAAAGRHDIAAPIPLHDKDAWYLLDLPPHPAGTLVFEGLATIAEVFVDGEPVLTSRSMYLEHRVPLPANTVSSTVAMVFRSLTAALDAAKGPRARWRTAMIPDQRLRFIRTTLLGHMPGWCPAVDCVGPWRGITFVPDAEAFGRIDIRADYRDGVGVLTVSCRRKPGSNPGTPLDPVLGRDESLPITLHCASQSVALTETEDGLSATLELPGIQPWWPHTHGAPTLHEAWLTIDSQRHDLPPVGFRALAIDRGADGTDFRIAINGVPVFARGAVWTPADLLTLASDEATLRPALAQVKAANLNMLRVGGTFVYESAAFLRLCDEMGIMVFQDLMLANFDYPASDPAFLDSLTAETNQLLDRIGPSPALVVVSGGSEIHQQAAMTGLPKERMASAFFDQLLPDLLARRRPDIAYVPSSPWGGALPFQTNVCITHYYGVGAYERPLDDARRATVKFASECLAFAHVPDEATLAAHLHVPAQHDPRWKARVPRDMGASWDFEDTRDHYLQRLYGVDPQRLRREDPARYLAAGRAVVAEAIEATIDEFRRPGSPTGGALVWFWRDFLPGAGWGYVDPTGRLKASAHALARASAPVRVLILDEGLNGLGLHVLNDRPGPISGTFTLDIYRDGATRVAGGSTPVTVSARGHVTLDQTALLGGFFDTTYAYRFGPCGHDLAVATLAESDGTVLAEAFHRPDRTVPERRMLGLKVEAGRDNEGGWLALSVDAAALHVTIECDGGWPSQNGFHLAPGRRRLVRITGDAALSGRVAALNGRESVGWSIPAMPSAV